MNNVMFLVKENSQSGNYTEEKTNIAADTNSEDKETTFSTEESEGNPHVHVDGKMWQYILAKKH